MECFNNLVGVRDMCGTDAPKSSLYMDDVGISLSDIESFITHPYTTAEDYFNSRQSQAIRELQQLIYNYFQGRYLATSLIDSHRLGIYSGTETLVAGSGYMGIQQEFTQSESFMKTGLGEVSLLINSTQTVDVEVWDLRQNKLLQTISLACVAGQIATGYLHKEFKGDKQNLNLFIGYDATGISSYRTPIKANLCCGKDYCSNSYMTGRGVSVSGTFYDANTTGINHTAGLSLVYDIKCDHLSWICSHGASLALPIAYKTGELMIADALFNTSGQRATNHHTVNIDQLRERYSFYVGKSVSFMTGWLENMQLPRNKCFYCDTPLRHSTSLP